MGNILNPNSVDQAVAPQQPENQVVITFKPGQGVQIQATNVAGGWVMIDAILGMAKDFSKFQKELEWMAQHAQMMAQRQAEHAIAHGILGGGGRVNKV